MAGDEGQAGAPAASVAVPARRPHRVRNLLLIVGAFLFVLAGVTGGVLAFLTFDKATQIDRSTPQVVARQFLDAALVLKDLERVELFVCDNWSSVDAMARVAAPTDPRISASWGAFATNTTGRSATVVVLVAFRASVGDGYRQDTEKWTLSLQDEDGWRVCGLVKEMSLEP